jgi:hypothetical protein
MFRLCCIAHPKPRSTGGGARVCRLKAGAARGPAEGPPGEPMMRGRQGWGAPVGSCAARPCPAAAYRLRPGPPRQWRRAGEATGSLPPRSEGRSPVSGPPGYRPPAPRLPLPSGKCTHEVSTRWDGQAGVHGLGAVSEGTREGRGRAGRGQGSSPCPSSPASTGLAGRGRGGPRGTRGRGPLLGAGVAGVLVVALQQLLAEEVVQTLLQPVQALHLEVLRPHALLTLGTSRKQTHTPGRTRTPRLGTSRKQTHTPGHLSNQIKQLV